jgi:hypothetical protein
VSPKSYFLDLASPNTGSKRGTGLIKQNLCCVIINVAKFITVICTLMSSECGGLSAANLTNWRNSWINRKVATLSKELIYQTSWKLLEKTKGLP